ncbi:MAG: hypothetical protein CMJ76_09910 [Planctomycetaceae bacterium]|nr:hypothetical protein [Planctomycetaceae bacterium]
MEPFHDLLPYLCAEQSTRWANGDHVSIEQLIGPYAEINDDTSALLDLIYHEIYLREVYDVPIDLERFIQRFPQLSTDIALMFEIHQLVDTGNLEVSDELPTKSDEDGFPDPVADVLRVLSETYPFSELPRDVQENIAGQSIYRVFDQGDYLVRQGDPSDSLLIIKTGEVEIRLNHSEQDSEVVGYCGINNVIGEIGIFTNSTRSANAIALGEVVALEVPLALYEQMNRDFPATSAMIANQVSERIGNRDIDVLTNKVLEGYRIIKRLGRGSMGVVYLAERVSDEKTFALKMLRHDILCNQKACQRFTQESEILRALNHPLILKTHQAFHSMATMFLVMDYCQGISLRKWMDTSEDLDIKIIKHIIGQLMDALMYAHQHGIIHRDVKPSNVMINEDYRITLMDFGLARNSINPSLTHTGELLGSPRYMAIEQFTGGDVGPKSDYYAIGCLLYEMLTGAPLFDSNDLVGMLTQRMQWTMPEKHEIFPDLENDVYDFLSSCLEADKEQRLADYELKELIDLSGNWRLDQVV